jgi:hypothetical protein
VGVVVVAAGVGVSVVGAAVVAEAVAGKGVVVV